jgi:hypothetical protein
MMVMLWRYIVLQLLQMPLKIVDRCSRPAGRRIFGIDHKEVPRLAARLGRPLRQPPSRDGRRPGTPALPNVV